MKKLIVKFLVRVGWRRLAYSISPSLTCYYTALDAMDAFCAGMRAAADSLRGVGAALQEMNDKTEKEV